MSQVDFLDCYITPKLDELVNMSKINWQQDLYRDPNISVIEWRDTTVLIRTSVSHLPRIHESMSDKFIITTVKKYKLC